MNKNTKQFKGILWATLFMLATMVSCKKDTDDNGGDLPAVKVPAELVGKWAWSEVSGSVIRYGDGRVEPTWARGNIFQIDANGTGFSIITAETHSYTSESVSKVEEDCRYFIELGTDGNFIFKCYPMKGKVYENGVFLHDLEKEKIYPAKSWNWGCTLVTDESGTYFESGGLRYIKQQ
ncbi:MAG: hypothetical protein QM802_23560 [Agriterribacter sp.]